MVAGSGTDVGKTVVAAILVSMLQGEYWKPIECSQTGESDSTVMQKLVDPQQHRIHAPAVSLKHPLSPHHAAALENKEIDVSKIIPPETHRDLIVEGIGGIFVPLNSKDLTIDLFSKWCDEWVIVSKNYLGSINHTLLTIYALQKYQVAIRGIIFNGPTEQHTESIILQRSGLKCLGRVFQEQHLDRHTIQRYANRWRAHFELFRTR